VKEFKQVRENLLDMLEDIDQGLSKITDDSTVTDKVVTKDLQDLSIKQDNQDSIVSDIDNIKRALSQIDSGTYGLCLNCGQTIKKEHLNSDPLSNYCIHCAENGDLIT